MKKNAILNSALELISERGVHNTPMSKVAKNANVAVGTIYHHFENKNEILNELYLQIKKEFGECTRKALDKSETPKEAFAEIFKAVYSYYANNPLKFNFTEQVAHTPIITDQTKIKAQQYYRFIGEYIQENLDNGTFRSLPLDLFGQLYYGNVKALIQMKLSDNNRVDETVLEEAIHTSWISFVNR